MGIGALLAGLTKGLRRGPASLPYLPATHAPRIMSRLQSRYAHATFSETLRSWPRCRDVKETTRGDWRVSTEDPLASKIRGEQTGVVGAYGHDMSTNDTEGWRTASPVWTQIKFQSILRDYKGVDVAHDEQGAVTGLAARKDKKHVAGTDLGNIYRSSLMCNVLTPESADKYFMGSMRSSERVMTDDYQRKRRANLNLPQFKSLTPEQVTKARRIFASIDLDGSGTIDADEMRKFLTSMGHKTSDKAVKKLLQAADEGVSDCKASVMEFCRLYHGLKL